MTTLTAPPERPPVSDTQDSNRKKVVVVGAGPGGYPAAFLAAHKGHDVTLIDERPKPGGVCLYVGCIPSKALLHVARIVHEAEEAAHFGLTFDKPKLDLAKLRAFKDEVVAKMTGGLGAMTKAHKISFLQGRARFDSASSLTVTNEDGKTTPVNFDAAIIATGSRPARPSIFNVQSEHLWDSTDALALKEVPKSLLIVGGGYIGLEMGTVYQALGAKVTVVEMLSGLLPGADRDLADVLAKHVKGAFAEVLTDTRVTELTPTKDGVKVKLVGLAVNGERTFDKVMVSIGRVPNSQDLGLERAGVEVDERGFVKVDRHRRTSAGSIWAIGDVAGEPGLAHKATHEGRVAVEHLSGEPAEFDPACIPAVVFTDPEVAWVGLTETQCLNEGVDHKVSRFPWAASGRAVTLGRTDGLTKLVIDPHSDRILGCGIVGIGAGDLIAEAALAIEMGATVQDLAHTIHPHPTTSETIMEAAELHLGHSAHFIARKR